MVRKQPINVRQGSLHHGKVSVVLVVQEGPRQIYVLSFLTIQLPYSPDQSSKQHNL